MTSYISKAAPALCVFLICLFIQAENLFCQTSDTAIKAAMAAIEKREYKQAIDGLTEVIKAEPKNDEAYAQRSRAYFLQGDNVNALADAKKAFDLNSKNTVALNTRGLVEIAQKDPEAALAAFNRSIKIDPTFVKPYLNRAGIWNERKEFDKAIADYTQVITLDPKNEAAYRGRGGVYMNGKSDYAAAIADFSEALKIRPDSPSNYWLRGRAYEFQKDHDRALADFNAALGIDPKNQLAYFHRALIYYNKNNLDAALADYTKLLELDPKLYEANFNRALIYKIQKRNELAAAEFRKVPADSPQYRSAQQQADELQPAANAGGLTIAATPFKLLFDPHAESSHLRGHITADQPFNKPNQPFAFSGQYEFTQPAGRMVSIQLALRLNGNETGGHLMSDLDAPFFQDTYIKVTDFNFDNIVYRVTQPLGHRFRLEVAFKDARSGTEYDLHTLDQKYLFFDDSWDVVNKVLFLFGNACAYNAFLPDARDGKMNPLTKNPNVSAYIEKDHFFIWKLGRYATQEEALKTRSAIMANLRRYLDPEKFEFTGGNHQFEGIQSKVIKVGVPSLTFHIEFKDGMWELTTWS